jgi:hypothetical protein
MIPSAGFLAVKFDWSESARARPRQHLRDMLEQLDGAIEPRVVAALLHDLAGVSDRGSVSLEQLARLGQAEPASDMGQVHRDLPGKRDLGASARRSSDEFRVDVEHPGDSLLEDRSQPRRRRASRG